MATERAALADMALARFSWLSLIIGLLAQVGAVVFFRANDLVIAGMNFSGDEELLGWLFMIVSMSAAVLALVMSIRMTAGRG